MNIIFDGHSYHGELDMDDALPCPFCGSEQIDLSNTWTACYSVECHDCDAEMQGPHAADIEGAGFDGSGETERNELAHKAAAKAALSKWNERVVL